MKLTLKEWIELSQLAEEAKTALQALDGRIIDMLKTYPVGSDESDLLTKLLHRTGDALSDLAANLYYPQTEWLGGDSGNPRNHTLREPNWVHMGYRFPKEQVDEFRNEQGKIALPKIRDGKVIEELSQDSAYDEARKAEAD